MCMYNLLCNLRPIHMYHLYYYQKFSLILSNPYISSYKIIYEYGLFNCQRDYWISTLYFLNKNLVSGYTLTTSSDKATIGQYLTFTCVTTYTLILFNKDSTTVCFISGSNTDGRCVLDGGYITCYTYTCNTTTNT
jgi:hypothetical protein